MIFILPSCIVNSHGTYLLFSIEAKKTTKDGHGCSMMSAASRASCKIFNQLRCYDFMGNLFENVGAGIYRQGLSGLIANLSSMKHPSFIPGNSIRVC